MKALPITYIVRAANVNDKQLVKQHSGIHILKSKKKPQTQKQAKNGFFNTYARAPF